jgi:hypothetical protein
LREIVIARNSRPQHLRDPTARGTAASSRHGSRITAPDPHPIGIGNCLEVKMTELDEIAQPRALEAAQNRAPGAIVIDKNELRRVNAGDENIVRSQIAMQVTGAMQARDFRAERAQNGALGGKRLALGA